MSQWLEWWEAEQVAGLDDGPRSGRPPKLTEAERQNALTIALQEPRTIKTGLKRIADEIGKLISGDTLRTLLNTERYVWKQLRRSWHSCESQPWRTRARLTCGTMTKRDLRCTPRFPMPGNGSGNAWNWRRLMGRAKTSWASSICITSFIPLPFKARSIRTP